MSATRARAPFVSWGKYIRIHFKDIPEYVDIKLVDWGRSRGIWDFVKPFSHGALAVCMYVWDPEGRCANPNANQKYKFVLEFEFRSGHQRHHLQVPGEESPHDIQSPLLLEIAILIDHLDFSLFATHIKEFQLLIRNTSPSGLPEAYKPRLNTIGALCASLSSVTSLLVTPPALDLLVRVEGRDYDVFPSLETLEVWVRIPWGEDGDWLHGLIANFLNGRLAKGRRLLISHISGCLRAGDTEEWEYLEAFKDLKIVWGFTRTSTSKLEYICGSGKPQEIASNWME